jgi:hypothetical protein
MALFGKSRFLRPQHAARRQSHHQTNSRFASVANAATAPLEFVATRTDARLLDDNTRLLKAYEDRLAAALIRSNYINALAALEKSLANANNLATMRMATSPPKIAKSTD